MEKGEFIIIVLQFGALIAIVLFLANFTPGQSDTSSPVISTVYWGPSNSGVTIQNGQTARVTQNQSVITAYFSVAFSTKVSAVSASRLCFDPASTSGDSITYNDIQFGYDQSRHSSYLTIEPTVQEPGWTCTYTVKVTDDLSQTTTWLGSVDFQPPSTG